MESIPLASLFALLGVLGVCGNAAVLAAFFRPRRASAPDVVVMGMSASHLLSSVFKNAPYTAASLGALALGDAACKALLYAINALRSASLAFTVLLSVLQFASVGPPCRLSAALARLLPRRRRAGAAARLVAATGALCALASAPLLAFEVSWRVDDRRPGGFVRVSGCVVEPSAGAVAFFEASSVLDVAALAVLLGANALVLGVVLRHRRLATAVAAAAAGGRRRAGGGAAGSAAALNAAKVIACLMVTAFVCWGVNVSMRLTAVQRLSAEWMSPQADVRGFFTSVYYSLSPFIIILGRSSIRSRVAQAARRCPCCRAVAADAASSRTRVVQLAVVDGAGRAWEATP